MLLKCPTAQWQSETKHGHQFVHLILQECNEKVVFARLEELFDELREFGGLYLVFTGGEIALRPDLFELIKSARKRHFSVQLLTSGTLWGEKEWDEIASLGVREVRLSLYGNRPEVHDRVTQVLGSHQKTLKTARALIERGVYLSLTLPILQENAHDVIAALELAESLSSDISIESRITWGDTGSPDSATHNASVQTLREIYKNPRIRYWSGADQSCQISDEDAPCAVGFHTTFIRSNGDVLPCSRWPLVGGNILSESIEDIFRRSPVFSEARALRSDDLKGCMECKLRDGCQICPAMNLKENGDVAKPSPLICKTTLAQKS